MIKKGSTPINFRWYKELYLRKTAIMIEAVTTAMKLNMSRTQKVTLQQVPF